MPFGSIKLNDGNEVGFRWDAMPWPLIVPARLTTRQIPAIAFGTGSTMKGQVRLDVLYSVWAS